MESGRHFKWIQDKELKELIYIYYTETEKLAKIIENDNEFAREQVERFVYKK